MQFDDTDNELRTKDVTQDARKKVILITGASGCGKTTSAQRLSRELGAIHVPQDSFYKHDFVEFPYDSMGDGRMEESSSINWDRMLDMIDLNKYVSDIVVEGHTLLSCRSLVDRADHIIFMDISKDESKKRFMQRGDDGLTDEQRQKKSEYYDKHSWPYHERYMQDEVVMCRSSDKFVDANFYTDILCKVSRNKDFAHLSTKLNNN